MGFFNEKCVLFMLCISLVSPLKTKPNINMKRMDLRSPYQENYDVKKKPIPKYDFILNVEMEERLNGAFSLMLVICCSGFAFGVPLKTPFISVLSYVLYAEFLYYKFNKWNKEFLKV